MRNFSKRCWLPSRPRRSLEVVHESSVLQFPGTFCLVLAFGEHGNVRGLSMCLLYNPKCMYNIINKLFDPKSCTSNPCSRSCIGQGLTKAGQREEVLYTLHDLVLPVYNVHVYCEGMQCILSYTAAIPFNLCSKLQDQLPSDRKSVV